MVKIPDNTLYAKKDRTYSYVGNALIPFTNAKNKSLFGELKTYSNQFDNLNLGEIIEELQRLSGKNKKSSLLISRYDANLDYQISSKTDFKKMLRGIQKDDDILKHFVILNYNKLGNEKFDLCLINNWLTYTVNKIYLQYCANNNIVPKGRIYIPEHFVHEVYLASSECDMIERIIRVVDNYIDDEGRVYSNCYAKYIKDSIRKITREDIISLEKFSPKYDQKFDTELYYSESKYFKSEKIPFRTDIAGRFLSRWVNPKYLNHISRVVICDKELCVQYGTYGLYYDDDYLFFHPRAASHVIVHELTHRIVDMNNLRVPTNNFLFENAKGDLIQYDSHNVVKRRIKPLSYNATKLNSVIENCETSNEFLPVSMDYLLGGVENHVMEAFKRRNTEDREKLINQLDAKIDANVGKKINRMYKVFPDLAIFTLAYFNGEL